MGSQSERFPLAAARQLVADLYTPDPRIYWADFIATMVVAYGAALAFLASESFRWTHLIWLALAAIGLYRLSLFMHEIVHFRRGQMSAFKVAWNLLAGIPMLTPSFLYESHLSHHNAHHYGRGSDGEYLPLGGGRLWGVAWFLAQPLFLPLFAVFRFLVVTPVSFIHPLWRNWTLQRMSSFVINFAYRREIPPMAPRMVWAWVELACFLRVAVMMLLCATGVSPPMHLPRLYVLAVATLLLNHVRTLVAHRYQSAGGEMDFVEQFCDSVNVSGRTPLVGLLFPVGLRYHALHHLFPSLPYHNLGIAHRRLMAALPEDSEYHRATYRTYFEALAALVRSCHKAEFTRPSSAVQWYASRERIAEDSAESPRTRREVSAA